MSVFFDKIVIEPVTERFVTLSMEVSERIMRILEEKGMTQRDLAKLLSKKDSEISKWLVGNHNLTLKTIAAIEVALGENFLHITGLEDSYYTTEDPKIRVTQNGQVTTDISSISEIELTDSEYSDFYLTPNNYTLVFHGK